MVTLVFVAVILAAVALDAWVIRPWTEKHHPRAARRDEGALEIVVPRTLFFHPGHTWARLDEDGRVTVGVDDLVRTLAGRLSALELPAPGTHVRAGEPAIGIRLGERVLHLPAPVSGTISEVNAALGRDPVRLRWRPYKEGWAFRLRAGDGLSRELAGLAIGRDAERWMDAELGRLTAWAAEGALTLPLSGSLGRGDEQVWALFESGPVDRGEVRT